jgi:hypothetical protein
MKDQEQESRDQNDTNDVTAASGESPREEAQTEPPRVIRIQDWKDRAAGRPSRPARAMLYEAKIRLLSTPQKQALLIRLIVCDDITPKEIDALVGVLAAPAEADPRG